MFQRADELDLGGVRADHLPRGGERRAGGLRAGARAGSRRSSSTPAGARSSPPRSSRRRERRPRRPRPAGVAPRADPPASAGDGAGDGRASRREPGDRGQVRPGEDRPQRSLLVRLGQEVQEVPRGLSGAAAPDAVPDHDFEAVLRASTSRTSTLFLSVLDPEVELHTLKLGRDHGPRGGAALGDQAARRPPAAPGDRGSAAKRRSGGGAASPAVALGGRRRGRRGELTVGGDCSPCDDGRIVRWRPFADRAEALSAAGVETAEDGR